MLEHQVCRLGAVAVAPGVLLADRDVVQRGAVVTVELAERARPDQPIRVADVDRHREAVGADDPRGEEPLDLVGAHRAVLVARQARDLRVAVPALEGGEVRRRVAAQDDTLADQLLGRPGALGHRARRIRYTIGAHAPLERARRAGRGHDADLGEDEPPRRLSPRPSTRRSCASPRSSSRAARSRRPTSGRRASAGRRSRAWLRPLPARRPVRSGAAYDRSSDLGHGRVRRADGRRPHGRCRRRPGPARGRRGVHGHRGGLRARRARARSSRRCWHARIRWPRSTSSRC